MPWRRRSRFCIPSSPRVKNELQKEMRRRGGVSGDTFRSEGLCGQVRAVPLASSLLYTASSFASSSFLPLLLLRSAADAAAPLLWGETGRRGFRHKSHQNTGCARVTVRVEPHTHFQPRARFPPFPLFPSLSLSPRLSASRVTEVGGKRERQCARCVAMLGAGSAARLALSRPPTLRWFEVLTHPTA